MISTALGNKAASIVSQLVLAWFLTRDDFGLTSLALTVGVLSNIFQQAGLKEALLRRSETLNTWIVPAFWLSLLAGMLTAAGTAAMAPATAAIYGDHRLIPLVLVLSVAPIFNALSAVPQAKLQAESHFKTIAWILSATHLLQVGTSILLAIMGFGAYSVIIPFPLAAAARAVVFGYFAPVPILAKPNLARCVELSRDGLVVTAAALVAAFQAQGDYMILGATHDTVTVGVYYFAFNLSLQTVALISVNLAYVALPTLANMQTNPKRQNQAFLEASGLVALVGVPLAFLQAALARPVLSLFFSPDWHDAVPVLQVLSAGMAFKLTGVLAGNFLQARARFVAHFWLTTAYTIAFLAVVAIASYRGGALSVAIGVAIVFAVFEPLTMFIAIRGVQQRLRCVINIYLFPLVGSVIAVGIGWWSGVYAGRIARSDWIEAVVTSVLASWDLSGRRKYICASSGSKRETTSEVSASAA